jgi:hypothetical protein
MGVASPVRLTGRSRRKQKDFRLTLRTLTEDCGPAKSERVARNEQDRATNRFEQSLRSSQPGEILGNYR